MVYLSDMKSDYGSIMDKYHAISESTTWTDIHNVFKFKKEKVSLQKRNERKNNETVIN